MSPDVSAHLDVTGASTADGAPVELWTCNGQSNQQWKLG
jgi:non-reducing end alpha-L-arabinofuranosidase